MILLPLVLKIHSRKWFSRGRIITLTVNQCSRDPPSQWARPEETASSDLSWMEELPRLISQGNGWEAVGCAPRTGLPGPTPMRSLELCPSLIDVLIQQGVSNAYSMLGVCQRMKDHQSGQRPWESLNPHSQVATGKCQARSGQMRHQAHLVSSEYL